MTLSAGDIDSLTTAAILELLAGIPDDEAIDRVALRLDKQTTLAPARLLAQQVRSRRKLFGKVPSWRGHDLLAHPRAVEQCSSEATARWRTSIIPQQCRSLTDCCAGLGVDATFAAATGRTVTAIDHDPTLTAILRHNASQLGVASLTARTGDGGTCALASDDDCLLLDPDRRADGRRSIDLDAYQPAIDPIRDACRQAQRPSLWKLAPGADVRTVTRRFPEADLLAVVSVGGECRELVVRCRPDQAPTAPLVPQAILLAADGSTRHQLAIDPSVRLASTDVGTWLAIPDAAIRRLRGTHACAEAHGLTPIAGDLPFLTADAQPPSFPGRLLRVLWSDRFAKREPRRWLAEHGIRHCNITCRNFPHDATTVLKKLKLGAGGRHDGICWRDTAGALRMVIGERVEE